VLRETGSTASNRGAMKVFAEFNELVGLPRVRSRENGFARAAARVLENGARRTA
jgi:hypothetical protein